MSEKSTIEMMQDLCAEHGCPPGINRFEWLDYMLKKLSRLEAERDALRKSGDQLADTLKNVHEAICETLGIEGDDSLPELVADWFEGEYAPLRAAAERYRWLSAEHDRIDPLAAVVWKSSGDRHGSQWCNTINAEDLARSIDAQIATKEQA